MDTSIRYFIYARKSTDVEDKQVRSIEAQLVELKALAKREGLSVADIIIEKESAKTPGARKQFNEMIDRIERDDADAILAWHPDRLARNMTDGGKIIHLIDTDKLHALRFPTFWFEPTPQGKFMLSMAFSQSKYYIDSMAENTKRGFREKIRRGEYPGLAPFGYLNDRRVKRIILDPERAHLVKEIYERYATGEETLDSLREFLASNGVTSRNGKQLMRGAVTRILRNPIYYGQFQYAGEIYDGIHPTLVSKRLFDSVQEILDRRWKWSPPRTKEAKIPKPFLRLLHCPDCGGWVTAEVQKGHTYYRCTKKKRLHGHCSQPYIREESLDEQLTRLLSRFSLTKSEADIMMGILAKEERSAESEAEALITTKRTQVSTLESKLNALLDLRLDGLIDTKKYIQRKTILSGRRKRIEEELSEIENGENYWLEPLRNWITRARNIPRILKTGSLFDKRCLASEIFGSNLFLDLKRVRGKALKPWSELFENQSGRKHVQILTLARNYFRDGTERG